MPRSTPSGKFIADLVQCRKGGDYVLARPRDDRLHRRLAQAARLGRRGADPVPRERRRQPRADGLEHAAPGGAAAPGRGAAGRHRHGRDGGPRLRASPSPPAARGIVDQVDATRIVVRATDDVGPNRAGRRHLQPAEVPALQPEHLHHPASAGEGRRPGEEGRHHRRRSVDASSASWRSAATCSSRSCRGTATTSRTRS